MRSAILTGGAALLISGCSGYFDQHPANVRPESEAVATVIAHERTESAARSPYASSAGTVTPATSAVRAPALSAPPPAPTGQAQAHGTAVLSAGLPALTEKVPVAATPYDPRAHVAHGTAPHVYPVAPTAPPQPPAVPVQAVPAAPRAPPPVRVTRSVQEASPEADIAPPPAALVTKPAPETEPEPPSAPAFAPSRPPPPAVASSSPPAAVAMQSVPETPPPVPVVSSGPDAHCTAVARQRADDAAESGMDRETQEIVRRGAYADCLSWANAHPVQP